MLKEFAKSAFGKAVIGLGLGSLVLAANPAFAEGFQVSKLLHLNSATAEQWIKDRCPDPEGNPQCENTLVLTTYSNVNKSQAFARAGYRAAKRLSEDGVRVIYAMANDNDNNPQAEVMMPYVNGQRFDGVGIKTTELNFISAKGIKVEGTEEDMYQNARAVAFRTGLIPSVAGIGGG